MSSPHLTVLLSWPSAPFTYSLVHRALSPLSSQLQLVSELSPAVRDVLSTDPSHLLLQWSSYDNIDHELTHFHKKNVLSSSYTFRKALIRKHFLSRLLHSYITKHPSSSLANAIPKTFEIEISFADELDEMWTDELWELGESLDNQNSWWILKPGMADRGMGIRMFNSKQGLQQIFEEFEAEDDQEELSDQEQGHIGHETTAVVTSQLRHFVIQEYVSNPLLLDPAQVPINDQIAPQTPFSGHKFHLRAYCVANGAIQLFLYNRILALFSSSPYVIPNMGSNDDPVDLTPHLTNTSLQTHRGEEGVRLLEELIGCRILSSDEAQVFSPEDVKLIKTQMVDILGETFKAALQNPVHFQPLPNAFELYGVDFLVTHQSSSIPCFQMKILEVNAEPAIELTGPRLSWILEDLFLSIRRVCVDPFVRDAGLTPKMKLSGLRWAIGETQYNLIKCMEETVRNLD